MNKETFIRLIKSLRDQRDYDFNYVNKLTDLYKADINPYDTSILTDAIFDLFEGSFPGKIGCIKIFCFELDYGRFIKTDGCPIEELWLELEPKLPKYIVSTHPLIDDIEVTYDIISPLPKK